MVEERSFLHRNNLRHCWSNPHNARAFLMSRNNTLRTSFRMCNRLSLCRNWRSLLCGGNHHRICRSLCTRSYHCPSLCVDDASDSCLLAWEADHVQEVWQRIRLRSILLPVLWATAHLSQYRFHSINIARHIHRTSYSGLTDRFTVTRLLANYSKRWTFASASVVGEYPTTFFFPFRLVLLVAWQSALFRPAALPVQSCSS